VDRVKKSFPNYHKEVDEIFTNRPSLETINFSTVGQVRNLNTVHVATHELTHSIFSVADNWSGNDPIYNPLKAVDELQGFIDEVDAFYYDYNTESMQLKKQKLLKVGDEALDISTYSKRIEDKLFNILSPMAAEEARANTGSNMLRRLTYGKHVVTNIDDTYNVIGGFGGYLDTENYADKLLRKHPLFSQQEVEVGDRGLKVLHPIEDFPELLDKLGRTKKEITLRVNMRVNAEYLGQLGELGGGYSAGPKGIESVLTKNMQDIFDAAYAIDGDLEKAYGYVTEYGEHLSRVSQESKNVSMSISTLPELGKTVRTKNTARC